MSLHSEAGSMIDEDGGDGVLFLDDDKDPLFMSLEAGTTVVQVLYEGSGHSVGSARLSGLNASFPTTPYTAWPRRLWG